MPRRRPAAPCSRRTQPDRRHGPRGGGDAVLPPDAGLAALQHGSGGGVGAAQSTRIRGDELRVDGFLGYVELRYNFFGVGAAAGGAGVSVPIVQKGSAFVPEILFQVVKNAFLGVRYRGVRVETALDGRAGPGILALRGFFCGVSDKTPLFDLCLYGAGSDLRGYEAGRYRDRTMFALQGEYRFPLGGRFGAVVFAGSGKVAPSFGDMGEEPDLPSIGAGLRWLASKKARVNLSVDVAKGRDGTAAYVYVKEAF